LYFLPELNLGLYPRCLFDCSALSSIGTHCLRHVHKSSTGSVFKLRKAIQKTSHNRCNSPCLACFWWWLRFWLALLAEWWYCSAFHPPLRAHTNYFIYDRCTDRSSDGPML